MFVYLFFFIEKYKWEIFNRNNKKLNYWKEKKGKKTIEWGVKSDVEISDEKTNLFSYSK